MTKTTFGVLLILAMAIPVSATVITSPLSSSYLNATLIDPSFTDGQYTPSIPVTGALSVNFSNNSAWYHGWGSTGNDALFSWKTSLSGLTIDFSTPVLTFGFEVMPWNAPAGFTVQYFSGPDGTGTLLENMTGPLQTGWGFFGAQDASIGSVKVAAADIETFAMSDMRAAQAPEPTTSLLLGAGLLGLGLVSRRRWAR